MSKKEWLVCGVGWGGNHRSWRKGEGSQLSREASQSNSCLLTQEREILGPDHRSPALSSLPFWGQGEKVEGQPVWVCLQK